MWVSPYRSVLTNPNYRIEQADDKSVLLIGRTKQAGRALPAETCVHSSKKTNIEHAK